MVTDYDGYKVHPLADSFPLMTGDEFDALVADINERGLAHPIVLAPDEKTIVDGRNRYRACVASGRDPVFTVLGSHYTEEMVIAKIVSENLRRRHLDTGQRALLGVEVKKAYAEAARERQAAAGRSSAPGRPAEKDPAALPEVKADARDQAAAAVGVSGRSIDAAQRLTEEAPDLAEQVRSGQKKLHAAATEARRRAPQPEKAPPVEPKPVLLTLRTHTGEEVPYPQPKAKSTFNPANEHISWAAWTWNPVTGCLHGCDYCYARDLATKPSFAATYPAGFTPLFHHERLDAPANTNVPKGVDADPRKGRVFVCSMADLYGRWVPREWIDAVHASMAANPQWEYLTLTKFPDRYVGLELPPTTWLGTSVDEQRRVRIAERAFAEVRGVKVRWLSLEPLREPLVFSDLSMFDWVVIGSQTETRQPDGVVRAFAPPFEWVARIVAQARECGTAVYLKPNLLGEVGPQSPGMAMPRETPTVRSDSERTANGIRPESGGPVSGRNPVVPTRPDPTRTCG